MKIGSITLGNLVISAPLGGYPTCRFGLLPKRLDAPWSALDLDHQYSIVSSKGFVYLDNSTKAKFTVREP